MDAISNEIGKYDSEEIIFSLDIGTRNVVGTLSVLDDDTYIVFDVETMEHPERAMFDGQIHDIEKVAKLARKIKKNLEERNGISIRKAAIAAAGRSLKTSRAKALQEIDYTMEITKETVDTVDISAIQLAQSDIIPKDGEEDVRYYCVGYNVINYFLDGSIISNPTGHRGNELGVEVIATFLPHIVVDSLYAVMSRAGIEVSNMTLEPIAAINVIIPEGLRLLNLALIDVGAGTSDIAITRDGGVVSFGMVSNAGDSITEILAKELLMDFNSAEKLKIQASTSENVEYKDVIGITHKSSSGDVLAKAENLIKKLADEIADEIITANGKSPSALFFIGGGSGIPTLTQLVAERLELSAERVTVKNIDSIQNLVMKAANIDGAEFITPVGIGYAAARNKENDFLSVTVNDKVIRLFNSRQLTVTDALILIGYSARKLLITKGDGYSIVENGKKRELQGAFGEPARIFVNGIISSLDTKLKSKDIINIDAATKGKQIDYTVQDVLNPYYIYLEGKKYNLYKNVKLNGSACDPGENIAENDRLDYEVVRTLEELEELSQERLGGYTILVNGKVVDDTYSINPGDKIFRSRMDNGQGRDAKKKLKSESDLASHKNESQKVNMRVRPIDPNESGDKEKSLKASGRIREYEDYLNESEDYDDSTFGDEFNDEYVKVIHEKRNKNYNSDYDNKNPVKKELKEYVFFVNGKNIEVKSEKQLIFVDIFTYYPFDLSNPKGLIELYLNGKTANYTDELRSGDKIEIRWKK